MGIEFWLGVVGAVGIPLGIAVGIVMGSTPSPGEFRFARLCFWVSAMALVGAHQYVLWDKPQPLGFRDLALAGLIGAALAMALAVGLNWVGRKLVGTIPTANTTLREFVTWNQLSPDQIATLKKNLKDDPAKRAVVVCETHTAWHLLNS